ncbi:MAG: hypothetical protein AAF754_19995 [Pseudomonadota bacterium]
MTVPIQLSNQTVRMFIHPEAGAVIRGCEFWDGKTWQPFLAPPWGEVSSDPTTSSFFTMLPWCNRLSTGNVAARSGDLSVPQTWHTTPMPVHGTGWLRPWQVVAHSPKSLELEIDDDFGPYSYAGKLRISLHQLGFRISAQVTNNGTVPLPFGVGFHPYFVRDRATILKIAADSIALTGSNGLPKRYFQWPKPREHSVHIGKRLRAVSAFFEGAQRAAIFAQNCDTMFQLSVDKAAGFLVWAQRGKEYFCVEPMSHQIDAFSYRRSALPHEVGINQSIGMTMDVKSPNDV